MTSFGETFARLAHAPLEVSSAAFNEARMGDGIRLLERPRIEQAFQQAAGAVAIEAGVPPEQVNALFPHEELQGVLDRLARRQDKALRAVRRQEMTVATFAMPDELPTAPSASEHLTSLSSTFSRDKDISSGLRDLAFEIAAWEALLKRCASTLDSDAGLQRSFRRRRTLKLLTTWGVLGLVLLGAAGAGLVYARESRRQQLEAEAAEKEKALVSRSQERATAALTQPDPCAPDALTDDDRARLTDEAKKGLVERQQRCEALRRKQAQDKACDELAAHVASGQLSAADLQLAGPAEATLKRLAAHAVTAPDLNLPDSAMPCAGSPAEQKLWASLAQVAASGGPNLWGLAEGVSPRLSAQLAAPGVLHPSVVLAIAFRAEKIATAALRTGREEDVKRARSMCSLKTSLHQAHALSCQKVLKP